MDVRETEIPGVIVIEPVVHRDDRGFFTESYHARRYAQSGIFGPFVQDNHSRSVRGTLRGLHAQHRRPQGKLIRAVQGEIFDVAVDIRPTSPTFKKWVGETLSAENFRQIYIPPGFAHGFCVLSDTAEVEYKCTDFYDPSDEVGVLWCDSSINIKWPIKNPVLSKKDAKNPLLDELVARLSVP